MLFKKTKYITVSHTHLEKMEGKPQEVVDVKAASPNVPNGMWVKCPNCGEILYKKDLEDNGSVCQKCKAHFRLPARERVLSIIDEDTFIEFDENMKSENPLSYPGYEAKIEKLQEDTGNKDAVITGVGKINGENAVIAVMDSFFLMGSMGSVVGEKITRAVEKATAMKVPIVIFTASGGARMQEGIFSLMQMAKVSAAIAKHNEAGQLYITVLTDPTTGGVTASFAMLGDIILSEPGALIGFAGRRVIEQTIKQQLPDGFQKAEFLLEHGFIDMIVERDKMKETLAQLLVFHRGVK